MAKRTPRSPRYVVTAPIVQVRGPNGYIQLDRGELLPPVVDARQLARLLAHGTVEELPEREVTP